ncbi:MAG TPA: 3-phosphoserine/phosphohydroxythreonine transaminase, partial [Buchnera sp. (in: enterobacteria)]|nr:3-phosphoserine/phosphohydroxythreonine transaminase [Buchnera sp. (in: enterobacteria)]
MKKNYNFSAGPAMLPKAVLKEVKNDLYNWKGLDRSVMEISHRSKYFMNFIEETEYNLRTLLNIPNNYKVLFCQGGARGQFSAIPMNLLSHISNMPDYINSGYWSKLAGIEAARYCNPHIIDVRKKKNKKIFILPMSEWKIKLNTAYIHYCPNETIDGIAIREDPNFSSKIIIGDFSSTILSYQINIKNYGIIYASAQKNIGPSGITVIIIRDDLLISSKNLVPSILSYRVLYENNSMFNTPPTFSWYLSGLVFKWLIKIGGIKKIQEINKKKALLLYQTIDNSAFYFNNVHDNNRSYMNVPFKLHNTHLTKMFLKEAYNNGLYDLRGHSAVGGCRASIYNAMP